MKKFDSDLRTQYIKLIYRQPQYVRSEPQMYIYPSIHYPWIEIILIWWAEKIGYSLDDNLACTT